jgi:hypothetical protein
LQVVFKRKIKDEDLLRFGIARKDKLQAGRSTLEEEEEDKNQANNPKNPNLEVWRHWKFAVTRPLNGKSANNGIDAGAV